MAITFRGETYPAIDMSRLTPGEADAIERATGLTMHKIMRMGEMCVCEHGKKAHEHKDDQNNQTDDTSCTSCDCDQHVPDVPSRVNTAFMWVGIKRKSPLVTFKEVADQAFEDFGGAEEESPDPTNRPSEDPETVTP